QTLPWHHQDYTSDGITINYDGITLADKKNHLEDSVADGVKKP
nr:hypothetical protein [Tanacetum cinerariifolium]